MSPQQKAMIEALQRRGINQVVVKPMSQSEAEAAQVTLTQREQGGYSATVEQLKAYYERQTK